jgi:hypothetical protein
VRRPLLVINICRCDQAAILERLDTMPTQADLDALAAANDANTTRILDGVGEVKTATDGIQADLDALKAANPALDLSALEASVARGASAADALAEAAAAVAAVDAETPAPVEPTA